MEIDFSILETIPPFPGDRSEDISLQDVEAQINALQSEIDSIALDIIPFDKTDCVTVFCCALAEILADTFMADPANPDSLASSLNNSKSTLGKWCNSIHEKIDHTNNPLDFQGRADIDGNIYFNGSGFKGPNVSYGGGDHRVRTYGHDLFRFWSAIKQIKDGTFRDSGFIDGVEVIIETTKNAYGNDFAPCNGWFDAVCKYVCHMFADFFSSKGLPLPGSSYLTHSSDRELRQLGSELYIDGVNLRTEMLKATSVAIPEIMLRIVHFLRYKDSEWSKEAKAKKLHLLLLITHGIASAFNIGKVIITENPESLNIPMITRMVYMAFRCIKDQLDFNARVMYKVSLSIVSTNLKLQETMIIMSQHIYYTINYQQLCLQIREEYNRRVYQRIDMASKVAALQFEYAFNQIDKQSILSEGSAEIILLEKQLPITTEDDDKSLKSICEEYVISDSQIENIKLEKLL